MKPGYPDGCRGAVLCYECWKAWQRWNLTHGRGGREPTAPDVCADCVEAEMAARFRDAATKDAA